ncbi:MAG TPA: Fe2+-dependent dioxygenase [Rhizomicrobium sp.]|jgi:PKHD-type hydroxylase|nr:Fe2+-dependent dioxygenase [Rhizomicrobium sp.]
MILELKDFLNPAEIARLTVLARELHFVNGRVSNPTNLTKDNLQADSADPRFAESTRIVADAFARSEPFRDFAFPKSVAPPLLCRYEPGMKYGAHADAAHLQVEGRRLQSDLSATVFIADPNAYQGGELVFHIGTRPVVAKGAPGEVIVYPSTMLHEVRPVRAGTRLVSITFIESLIPNEHHRTQLYELNEVAALEGLNMQWENRVRLETVRQNLTRLWSKS